MSRAIGSVRLLVMVVVVFIVGRTMLQYCNAAYGSDTHNRKHFKGDCTLESGLGTLEKWLMNGQSVRDGKIRGTATTKASDTAS